MFKEKFPLFFLVALLTSTLASAFTFRSVEALHQWVVDDDGVADFHTIQEAIAAAFDGDSIFVKEGLYQGPIWLYKPLSLVGENRDNTIVEGNLTTFEFGFVVIAPNVSLTKFTVRRAAIGVCVWYCNGTLIRDNVITDNGCGIQFFASYDGIICHNDFIYNFNQIEYFDSSNAWDNGCEGNFWTDYLGSDSGADGRVAGDGIGDTQLPHNGVDYYPLMEPWTETRTFSIKWNNDIFKVQTFSNTTVASFNFSQPQAKISFRLTCPPESTGFCNVSIPKRLLNGDFVLLLDGSSEGYSLTQNETHSFLSFCYLSDTHQAEISGTEVIEPLEPQPPPTPRRFRLLAIEQMFDSMRMKSAQHLIETLLKYANWNNSTEEYVSHIHLLSMYAWNEVDEQVRGCWRGVPSSLSIKDEVQNFLAEASPGEIVIFYYVGHTLISFEHSRMVYRFCGVSSAELKQWLTMSGLEQAYITLIMDTCYSGHWTEGILPDKNVLVACKKYQSAWGHSYEGHFTFGIREGFWTAEDSNDDGWVSAAEVFSSGKEYVELHYYTDEPGFRQEPQCSFGVLDGDIPLVLRDETKSFPEWDLAVASIDIDDVERCEPGYILSINATVENQGVKTADFSVSVYCNDESIGNYRAVLLPDEVAVFFFLWNTSKLYGFYITNVTATASCSPGEVDLADNSLMSSKLLKVGMKTDCNLDGYVDISDIHTAAVTFGAESGHSRWNPEADINQDNYVGIDDIALIAEDFGKEW